jgi:hypothetical protein
MGHLFFESVQVPPHLLMSAIVNSDPEGMQGARRRSKENEYRFNTSRSSLGWAFLPVREGPFAPVAESQVVICGQ